MCTESFCTEARRRPVRHRDRNHVSSLIERLSDAATGPSTVPLTGMPVDSHFDDTLLGRVLISTWVLHTGRTLRRDVPPNELPVEELIAFWADPLLDEAPAEDRR